MLARLALAAAVPLAIAGCTAEPVWAPEAEVQRAIYRAEGPPTITLYTMVNNRSNSGAHSGLMISGSQRVIFDPAGSFHHPHLPERNDVHFGMTDDAVAFYIDYHSRETYRVVEQVVEVTPAQAEAALKLVQEYGPVGKAFCNSAITDVLRDVPGFEKMPRSMFPNKTMNDFGRRYSPKKAVFTDDSPDNRGDLVKVPDLRQR